MKDVKGSNFLLNAVMCVTPNCINLWFIADDRRRSSYTDVNGTPNSTRRRHYYATVWMHAL